MKNTIITCCVILVIGFSVAMLISTNRSAIQNDLTLHEEKIEAIKTIAEKGDQRLDEIEEGTYLDENEAISVIRDTWPLLLENDYVMMPIKISAAIKKLYRHGFVIQKEGSAKMNNETTSMKFSDTGDIIIEHTPKNEDVLVWQIVGENEKAKIMSRGTVTGIKKIDKKKEGCTNCMAFPQMAQGGFVEWDGNIEAWYMNGISIDYCPWCGTSLK